MNDLLTTAITEDEIKAATFQLRRTKAPEPDGLNGLFYQTYWNTLCVDFIPLIQQFFFISGVMPLALNQTIITLIPKVSNPKSLDQYRPISLCNYAYKIISKVIANRLKPWLPELISP